MEQKPLKQLCLENTGKVFDKWEIYLSEYDRIFTEYRERPVNLLEIGIQNGGSLEIWSKYFPLAHKLVGCDIDAKCGLLEYEDPRIAVVIGDANTDVAQAQILDHVSTFQIVIDDGSHRSGDIIRSFCRYFPYLSDGGVFIAEDLHCSYWREAQGGLFNPNSSIEFFKRLADVINYEHWGNRRSRIDILRRFKSKYRAQLSEELLQHIHSLEFINSMCVIRKTSPQYNRLGARLVSGSDAKVIPNLLARNKSESQAPRQGLWPYLNWCKRHIFGQRGTS
jgi:cephalosporin hydroxylase